MLKCQLSLIQSPYKIKTTLRIQKYYLEVILQINKVHAANIKYGITVSYIKFTYIREEKINLNPSVLISKITYFFKTQVYK